LFLRFLLVPSPDPLEEHFPVVVTCSAKISTGLRVEIPVLQPPINPKDAFGDDFGNYAEEIYEWLSLIALESPRLSVDDCVDPFLSRYSPPLRAGQANQGLELVKISWEGFISPSWAHRAFIQGLQAATPDMWFSFAVSGFSESLSTESTDTTILKLAGFASDYMLWEVE
jgi:ribonucleases P/MRP protein subunit RPP40